MVLAVGLPGPAVTAAGEGESDPAVPASEGPAKPVGLDALLRLPPVTAPVEPAKKAGDSRVEWAERFDAARAELVAAESRLSTAQDKLGRLSANSSAWQLSAPGGQATENGPLSFELRKQIREGREDVQRAKNALDELRIEANLAGVPEAWTPSQPPAP